MLFELEKWFLQRLETFNSEKFSESFNEINWQTLLKLESNDPDLSFDAFYSKLTDLVNEHVPIKEITKKNTSVKVNHGLLRVF